MLERFRQLCHACFYTLPRRWLQRTRFWRLTSPFERKLAFVTLVITIPAVYFLAQEALASKRMADEIECLALNIYHESRGEPLAGQYAVAEVTLNRTRSADFPDTVCKVVYQKHWNPLRKETSSAFSWTAFTVTTNYHSAAWRQAVEIARSVLLHERKPTLQGALFYHTVDIKPEWSRNRKRLAQIGRHIFYL